MLASAFVARHRRVHSRGSDATERREERQLLAGAPAPPYRVHGRRRATQQDGPRHGSARRQAGTELAPRRRTAPEAGAEQGSVAAAAVETEDAPGPAAVLEQAEEAGSAAPPSSEASSADLCAVCLEELRGEAEEEAALPCSHAACVRPWLAAHRACPCCRAAVPLES